MHKKRKTNGETDMKKMRVSSSLNLHFCSKENVFEYVREGLVFHKKMGFDAANLDFEASLFDADGWQPYIENARKDSEEIGVKIELAHLPFVGGEVQKDEKFLGSFQEKMCRAIDGAKLLAVNFAVLHPITPTLPVSKYDAKEQRDLVLKNLAPLADYAAKRGVNLVIENMRIAPHFVESHRFCQTAEELCGVADTLGFGVCWDFGHANISGIKQSEGLAYVGKRLKVLHVNDNAAFEDDHLLPFMGTIDWKDAMHGLALADFDGLFNYEVSTKRQPASVREDTARYLLSSADELMSYIK